MTLTYFPVIANYISFAQGSTVNGQVTFTPNLNVGQVALITGVTPPLGDISAPTLASITNGNLQTSPVASAPIYLPANTSDLNLSNPLQYATEFQVNIGGQNAPVPGFVFNAQTPRTVSDAHTVINTTTLTSATAAFTSNDVGAVVTVAGALPAGIVTIASVTNSTTAVLSTQATATVTGAALSVCQALDLITVTPAAANSVSGLLSVSSGEISDSTPIGRQLLTAASGAAALTDLGVTSFAQSVLADSDAPTTRTTLGVLGAVASAAPPLAADVTQGLYARTIPSPSGEATIRPYCTDPNNTGYVWAFGATSSKIGWTNDHGATFHPVIANPNPAQTIQQAKITTNFMWLLTSAGTDRNGQLWRSPAPNNTGLNLAFSLIFDLSVSAPFVFNSCFRETCFDILPDESKAYLVTYGGGNASLALGGNSDGIMTAGNDLLFSASGGSVFSGACQGASITVTGAGASGATLSTTIAEVYDSTRVRLNAAAQTTVSAATYNIPSQTYGAGNVIGGPRLYRSDNPNTGTPGSVTFTQAYNAWNWGRHAHAVKVIGGVPWVSIGDYNWPAGARYGWPPLTHAGLYAATDNTGGAFNLKVPTTITSPHVFINFLPITVGGQSIIVGESDGPLADGPIFCPTQSNAVGPFAAISPVSPTAPPQVATMRALTITAEGNLMWLGTGESGAVGPVDTIMLSKPPFAVAVVLEQMANNTITFPQQAIQDGNYVWIGTHRIAKEKFIGQ